MKNVCVFGASCSNIDKAYIDGAYRMGELLAQNGIGMVFGGGRSGLMGAAARGVYDNGGRITGVIPEKLNRPGIAFEQCSELIVTPDMHSRKATMESISDCFVALPGGFGTLEELMEVLTLNQLGYISAPVIILNINGYYERLLQQLRDCVEGGFTSPACLNIFSEARTAEQALELLKNSRIPVLPDKIGDAIRSMMDETR